MRYAVGAVLALLLVARLGAHVPADRVPRQVRIGLSQVFLTEDVQVPSRETGPLIQINVREGQMVQPGDLLAQIDDRQAQLQKRAAEIDRDAAQARAEDDIEIRYAVKSLQLAEIELEQDLEINRRSPGAVPETEIRRKQLTKHRAELQVSRSQLEQDIARMAVEGEENSVLTADESIRRRRIEAPFGGMVIDVYRQRAEWVNSGEPLLRMIRLDRLRVDGLLSASDYNTVDVADRPVTVEVELARGRSAQFSGKVVFVSPLVQAGNKYRVRAEVQNRSQDGHWLLRPGMSCSMTIQLR